LCKEAPILILYTQDCDLINLDLGKEPFAEFFCAKKITSIDTSYEYGKNPRILHIEIDSTLKIEININHRITVDRSILTQIKLQKNNVFLPRSVMDLIVGWFSKKYSRPAFPNEFNRIIGTIRNIDKTLTKINSHHKEIKRIFFDVDPDLEIEDDKSYNLQIIILLQGQLKGNLIGLKANIEEKSRNLFNHERS